MQHSITSLDQAKRDELTLSLLAAVTPLLRRFSISDHLDFDELYQDACVWIMHELDTKYEQIVHLRAYMMVAVHHRILNKLAYLKRRRPVLRAVSLDDSLLEEISLADILPDPYAVLPETVVLAREQLGELQLKIETTKHYGTRRMLRELRETALAGVSPDERRA